MVCIEPQSWKRDIIYKLTSTGQTSKILTSLLRAFCEKVSSNIELLNMVFGYRVMAMFVMQVIEKSYP